MNTHRHPPLQRIDRLRKALRRLLVQRRRGPIAARGDRIRRIACGATNELGLSALLVRPDGFVAWASDTTPAEDEFELAAIQWW
jgi:hypothetical protein